MRTSAPLVLAVALSSCAAEPPRQRCIGESHVLVWSVASPGFDVRIPLPSIITCPTGVRCESDAFTSYCDDYRTIGSPGGMPW